MEDEKDRFGETMRLVERAREDIYFAAKDRELIEKLKEKLRKVERAAVKCPKCPGQLESYEFMKFMLDHCPSCGGVWMDKGELEGVLKKVSHSSLASMIKNFLVGGDD